MKFEKNILQHCALILSRLIECNDEVIRCGYLIFKNALLLLLQNLQVQANLCVPIQFGLLRYVLTMLFDKIFERVA